MRLTTIAGVGVGNQRNCGIETGDHGGVVAHIVEGSNPQVRHAKP
jgi:hypothetical protein